MCWPLNVIGEPDIIPLSFKKAIIEPEKVIAPIAAPRDISIKLASLIFPTMPRPNASGFKNADIATKTVEEMDRILGEMDFKKETTSLGIKPSVNISVLNQQNSNSPINSTKENLETKNKKDG